MTQEILSYSDGCLILDASLSSEAFARIHIENEEGFLVSFEDGKASFGRWKFERNFKDEQDRVFFEGPAFAGKTLSSIFQTGTDAESFRAGAAVITALTSLIQEEGCEDHQGSVGAGGIFVSDDYKRVLICPQDLFSRCCSRKDPETQSELQGIWENKALFGKAALSFTRAAIAYRAFTGKNAFSAVELTERQADIHDRNFIPSHLLNSSLEPDLSAAIDDGFTVSEKLSEESRERRFLTEKEKEEIERSKLIISSFPLQDTIEALQKIEKEGRPSLSTDQAEAVTKWQSSKRRKVFAARFIRRNQKRLIVAAIAAVVAASVAANFHRENGKLATTLGLTAEQTVQTLYTGIHRSDVGIIREVYKGKGRKDLLEIVSGYFITYRQRLAFNQDDATVSPAAWLFLQNQTNYWMYGVTNFYIEGQKREFPFAYPVRNDKKKPLTKENGGGQKGETRKVSVSYNLVHTDSSNRIVISSVTDTVTVKWNSKRWIVTAISGKTATESVSMKTLREKYGTILEETGSDIRTAARLLQNTYHWIPEESELYDGALTMVKDYSIKAASDFLENQK